MKKWIITIIAFLLLFITASRVSAESIPAFPMAFWGSVTVNGNPAPVGTVIRAKYYSDIIGSTLAGTVTVQESGIYGYTEPIKQKLVIGEGIGELIFTFQSASLNSGLETSGCGVVSYAGFTSGLTVEKDLAFNTTGCGSSGGVITVPTSIPSGGGGGSYTPPASSPLSAAAQNVDTNKDGKIDVLDFNSLMVNWGKTGIGNITDFNSDGKVDIFDFNLLMINWTK